MIHTTETRKKISEARKKYYQNHKIWNFGKKGIYSEDTLKKMSIAKKNKPLSKKHRINISVSLSGENNYRWCGGITQLRHSIRNNFYYRQWRSDIFTRDNFTCQCCGDCTGGKLQAHHIISFQSILQKYEITTLKQAIDCEELWNINNGITLCKCCHEKKRGGN